MDMGQDMGWDMGMDMGRTLGRPGRTYGSIRKIYRAHI